ncbi:hypothetical protein M0Q28_04565 [Patescibacteria group bacterium]|jgi:hypothetical protein|nr:hypothetical protein [Patescibacteria group bacterium]
MRRPWVQSLLCFLVTLIGLESITGLVWLFNGGDKMIEICLWGGVGGAVWVALRSYGHAVRERPPDPLEMSDAERPPDPLEMSDAERPPDPLEMSDAERREHLRRVRSELDKRT